LDAYLAWTAEHHPEVRPPGVSDDVAIRDYLLHLRLAGADRDALDESLAALRRFYGWAAQAGYSAGNPFDEYRLDRPFLSRSQIRRRTEPPAADRQARELRRLQALTDLAEQLHRAPDARATLEAALTTLVEVLGLQTAWAFVLDGRGADFGLEAVCGLPPGLEQQDRHFLRRPPDCHCQALLRDGRLRRAVNIVECTRLMNAARAAGDNAGLLFHATVPLFVEGAPAGLLNFATEEWQFLTAADLHTLSAVGAHVSLALERARLFDLAQAQRARMQQELAMARQVQAGLLPAVLPAIPGHSLAAAWRSALEMAGDFYDVFPLPGGRWGLIVADVSDKGAAAGLYMAAVSALLHARADLAGRPSALLAEVNRALYRLAATGMFVTLFYAVLDPAAGRLDYSNAGHNPPLVRRASGAVERLPKGGMAMGLMPEAALTDRALTLGQGEALIAYTDGVTEALNPAGEEFGLARLAAVVGAAPPRADAIVARVSAELADFTGELPPADDLTLLVLACG
jgi:serine phosphatase RsbU (regulator of sigma subunit)